jgi:cytochrome c-type biogenesis protein CcmH
MMRVGMRALVLLALCFAYSALAMEPVDYQSPAEAQRHRALSAELRCVMCQNQSIADSNAPIAHDLRMEVLRLMREGKDDAQIKDYLVARYSEFVLYEPPLRGGNWLLWAGPFALLAAGGLAVFFVIRRKRTNIKAAPENNNEEW